MSPLIFSIFFTFRRPPRSTLFPTRRSSDLRGHHERARVPVFRPAGHAGVAIAQQQHRGQAERLGRRQQLGRSEEHTSELQSHVNLVCRLLLEKKKTSWSSLLITDHKKYTIV